MGRRPNRFPEQGARHRGSIGRATWTLCSGFYVQGHEYLFLNDATCEDGAAEFGVTAAALFGQILDELANAFHMQGIVNKTPTPRLRYEASPIQLFQMKREACGTNS